MMRPKVAWPTRHFNGRAGVFRGEAAAEAIGGTQGNGAGLRHHLAVVEPLG